MLNYSRRNCACLSGTDVVAWYSQFLISVCTDVWRSQSFVIGHHCLLYYVVVPFNTVKCFFFTALYPDSTVSSSNASLFQKKTLIEGRKNISIAFLSCALTTTHVLLGTAQFTTFSSSSSSFPPRSSSMPDPTPTPNFFQGPPPPPHEGGGNKKR